MSAPPDRDETSGELYSLEMVERITHIARDRILIYQQYGLIRPAAAVENEARFDEEAIHRLRRIAFILSEYELNEKGLQVFSSLMDEVERLREELRFLRR